MFETLSRPALRRLRPADPPGRAHRRGHRHRAARGPHRAARGRRLAARRPRASSSRSPTRPRARRSPSRSPPASRSSRSSTTRSSTCSRGEGEPGHLRIDSPPAPILMVGLQGSGKTTTTAKLARRLKEREGKRVLMASLDTRRPAAMEQLAILGAQIGVDTLPIVPGQDPVAIAKRARQQATLGGYDVAHARHRRPPAHRRRADGRGRRRPRRDQARTRPCSSSTA